MKIQKFIQYMPKVELHVHLEGSIRPETLLKLATRNNVALPASSLEELRVWYQFSDFDHFLDIYFAICNCIRTPEDFDLITSEFLKGQAEQNIKYSEVIFTPFTHREHVAFDAQLAAINRARKKAEKDFDIQMGLVPDISRQMRPIEDCYQIANWAIENMENGVIALGLGGPEIGNPPELFREVFKLVQDAGLPGMPHAGETEGPQSIWGAIDALSAVRIGHGVRCLEDAELVDYLRRKQLPLDVCPTSNVCLGVVPALTEHPLPRLLAEGLFITINSDDPPMFGTTLTDEYFRISEMFDFDFRQIKQFVLNGIQASLLPSESQQALENEFILQFGELENQIVV